MRVRMWHWWNIYDTFHGDDLDLGYICVLVRFYTGVRKLIILVHKGVIIYYSVWIYRVNTVLVCKFYRSIWSQTISSFLVITIKVRHPRTQIQCAIINVNLLEGYLLGLTIAAKFTITIVTDSQKYYHDRLSIVDFTIEILSQ